MALIESVPGDVITLDRLASLAAIEHDSSEVARLRSKKSDDAGGSNKLQGSAPRRCDR